MRLSSSWRTGASFEEWEHRVCRTFVPLRARRELSTVDEFRGEVASTSLGSVVLAEVTADRVAVERTPRLIPWPPTYG